MQQSTHKGFLLFGCLWLVFSLIELIQTTTIGFASFLIIFSLATLYFVFFKYLLEFINSKVGSDWARRLGLILTLIYAILMLGLLTVHFFTNLRPDGFYLYAVWILFGVILIWSSLGKTTMWMTNTLGD